MQLVRQNKANLTLTPGTWYAISIMPSPNDVVAMFANSVDARMWAVSKYPNIAWTSVELTIA